jgi:hypothetical protein
LGRGDYPSFPELERMVQAINRHYSISTEDDIIVCEPPIHR